MQPFCLFAAQRTGQEELLHKHVCLHPFCQIFSPLPSSLSCSQQQVKAGRIQLQVVSAEQQVVLYGFAVALLLRTMNVSFSVNHMPMQHECNITHFHGIPVYIWNRIHSSPLHRAGVVTTSVKSKPAGLFLCNCINYYILCGGLIQWYQA